MSSFFRRIATSFTRKAFVGALAIALGAGAWYSLGAVAAPPKADLDQARNGSAASRTSPVFFQNGSANGTNSHYTEGHSIPYRLVLSNLSIGEHTLNIEWDIKHSGRHAIDFITSYDRLEPHTQYGHAAETVDPIFGVSGVSGSPSYKDIPVPSGETADYFNLVDPSERRMAIWNGSIQNITYGTPGDLNAAQSSQGATISFTATSSTVVISWGGHIAREEDWGDGMSAGGISGAPYHTRLLDLDGSGGNQDRSLSADAVIQAQTGTITIVKDAVPNDAQDFTFTNNFGLPHPTNFSLDDDSDPTLPNTQTFTVPVGTYSVTEAVVNGWLQTGATCSDQSLVTAINVSLNENITCTFTNTKQPKLTVIKQVNNDNGGTKVVSDFPLQLDGQTVVSGVANTTTVGAHTVSETSQAGYIGTISGACNAAGQVTLAAGQEATCTITNDDQPGTLTVIKQVENDFGGTATPSNFSFQVNNGTATPFEANGTNVLTVNAGTYTVTEPAYPGYATSYSNCADLVIPNGGSATCTITNQDIAPTLTLVKTVTNDNGGTLGVADFPLFINGNPAVSGQTYTLTAGSFTATETNKPGYAPSEWSGGCAADGTVTLAIGENKTCTINNNDIQPKLTLVKTVINNNGGTKNVADFPLKVGNTTVTSGAANGFNAGSYVVSETTDPGYQASSWGGACSAEGNITLAVGDDVTCSITNDDKPGTLTVIKHVINDNGGTKTAGEFTMSVTGTNVTPASFAGSETGTVVTLNAGTFSVGETELTGYTMSLGTNCSGAIANGESKTCTVTNDDQPGTLIVSKVLVQNNGGTDPVTSFSFQINGGTAIPFEADASNSNTVNAGTYTVVEPAVFGYATSYSNCTNVVIPNGGTATCTITNDDIVPTLKIVKTVVNSFGGTKQPSDFALFIDGNLVTNNQAIQVAPGLHSATETNLPGYTASSWGGDCAANGSVSLSIGQNKTCTITNSDVQPKLTLIKTVVNNHGGTKNVADFPLNVSGTTVLSGVATGFNAGNYTAGETSDPTYTASTWGGACAANGSVTLVVGDDKTCTITNDDKPASLTVIKHVENNSGGAQVAGNFTMSVTGIDVSSPSFPGSETGTTVELDAGIYSVGETGPAGYTGSFSADCTGTIANGESKTCTVTNDDQPGTLIVRKIVQNDAGGLKGAQDFTFSVNGAASVPFEGDGQNDITVNAGTYSVVEDADSGYETGYDNCANLVIPNGGSATCTITNRDIAPLLTVTKVVINNNGGTKQVADFPLFVDTTSVTSGVQNSFSVGTYTVSETALPGYTGVISGDCASNGSVSLALGQVKSCTITNNDEPGTLIVRKIVVNDDGGQAEPDDFSFKIGNGDSISFEGDGQNEIVINAGTYTITENAFSGYTASYDNCTAVSVANGGTTICTITNDDQPASLTVIKLVQNDDGGELTSADFTMQVTGANVSLPSFPGSESGTTVTLDAGSYSVGEIAVPGYTMSLGTNCSGTIANGQSKTCTVTNNDQPGTLIVIKNLTTDNGGTEVESDFEFSVNGGSPVNFDADGQNEITVDAGTYTVTEVAFAGYVTTYEGCEDIVIPNGGTAICTISNDDIAPQLTLVKTVLNDNGGTLEVEDFQLFVDDVAVTSGVATTLNAGSYTASETEVATYAASAWGGDCAADGSVTLSVGQVKTCTITNDDIPATLIVEKIVTNDNGGTATADSFSFSVNGGDPVFFDESGSNSMSVDVGVYSVVESAATGYTTAYEGCSQISLGLAETATCTITNDDIAPQLTIIKNVINDEGGTLTPSAFTLAVTATNPSSATVTGAVAPGVTITLNAGSYEVTEPNSLGYLKSFSTDCIGTIAIGESKTCTVTNNDPRQEREGTIGFWRNWNMHKTYTAEQINGWLATIDAASNWLMFNPLAYSNDTTGMVRLINDATGCKGSSPECTQKKFYAQYLVTRLNVESEKKSLAAVYDLTLLPSATSYLGVSATPTLGDVITAIEAKVGTSPTRNQFNMLMTVCDTINNIGL